MNKRVIILITIAVELLISGCYETIYVDQRNTAGPWDGTADHPYKTIQEGLNAAEPTDTVKVYGGRLYSENVFMKRGVVLEAWEGTGEPLIVGAVDSPTIWAMGDNTISGFIIEGGTAGIRLDLGTALSNIEETTNVVRDCRIRGTHRGIEVKTLPNLVFDSSTRKIAYVSIIHNWLRGLDGDGINFELLGPSTGQLQISLDIRDNVLQEMFTGISLKVRGEGPNPDGIVRASYAGYISNNLIFEGVHGIHLQSENLGSADPFIFNNTIAKNVHHGISAHAEPGPDGDASTHPHVSRNIIVYNGGYGYQEFDSKTSARVLSHNLFYMNNRGHYNDYDTDTVINSQSGLNTPIVNNKVVFYGGSGNLVADPLFVEGEFRWKDITSFGGAHAFFLNQNAVITSPAVDAGDISVQDAGLETRTTSTDFTFDTGVVDIGFHYMAS